MTQLYLDIREDLIAFFVQRDNKTVQKMYSYVKDFEDLKTKLKLYLSESDIKPDTAHIILPSSEVIFENITLQNVPMEDAEFIIRNKIISERDIKSPLIHLTPLGSDKMQQTYLVETIEKEIAEKYTKILSANGVKVRTLSTPIHANIRFFRDFIKSAGTFGILDLGREFMEFTVISDSVLILHERIPIQKAQMDEVEKKLETFDRLILFKIVEKFHNLYKRLKNTLPDQSLSKVFLCGPLCVHKELIETLSEIIVVEPLVDTDEDAPCLYASIKGLIRGVLDNSIVNFLERSGKFFSHFEKRCKRYVLITMVIYLILLSGGFFYVENKYKKASLRLKLETKELSKGARKGSYAKRLSYLVSLSERDIPFYEILRYLANNLPEGIFLEKVNYIGKDDKTIIEFNFIIKDTSALVRESLLTQLSSTLNNSSYLKNDGEPSISIVTKDKAKIIQVRLAVEVSR